MIFYWLVVYTEGDLNYRKKIKSIDILHSSFVIRHSSFLGFPRYIAAKGFFRKIIAGGLKGSRPAAAAYPFELAGIAFAL